MMVGVAMGKVVTNCSILSYRVGNYSLSSASTDCP